MKLYSFEVATPGAVLCFYIAAASEADARAELIRVRNLGKIFDPNKTGDRVVRIDREAERKHTIFCEDPTVFGEAGVFF